MPLRSRVGQTLAQTAAGTVAESLAPSAGGGGRSVAIGWRRSSSAGGGRSLARALVYVLAPTVLLLAAHFLATVTFDLPLIYLRLASLIIPLPFGIAACVAHRIGPRGALCIGVATALLSVGGMLTVIGYLDNVPILPGSWNEWRETFEYAASIALSLLTGNIMAVLALRLLPSTIASGDKPNPAAFRVALLLGPHLGEDARRRRARKIQDLAQTIGPLAGVAASAYGSIYTGLKSLLAP